MSDAIENGTKRVQLLKKTLQTCDHLSRKLVELSLETKTFYNEVQSNVDREYRLSKIEVAEMIFNEHRGDTATILDLIRPVVL